MTLKIGIDLRQIIVGVSGGISQLVKGICEHMFALYPEHHFFVFCTPFNRRLLDHEVNNLRYFSLPIPTYFQDLDRIAKEQGLDVLFRAYPAEYDTLDFPLCKQIFLIPDNQHETFPEFFSLDTLRSRRVAFSRALGGAGAIGTISEFARKALLDYPGTHCTDIFLMEPSLQVVHERGSSEADLTEAEKQWIPPGEFFLFPANLWKHKNHRRMLEAFRLLLREKNHPIELILTGHPSGWAELSEEFSDLPIRHLGFVRPEFLRALLERARALVFFSLYEGFGIPLLEAFDAGTPVICSNTTSLPEVGGDAVLMCSPTDIKAMSSLMEQILTDENLRASLVERGKAQLKKYSWENSANNLIAACERVSRLGGTQESLSAEQEKRLPLVSIVTPSFNQGRFLKRTIESVLSQSYPNIEYVVIDGGSTDESVEILRSYGDKFYWVSGKDKGQTDAINKGMARVQGEILAYLNSDDVLLPGAVERVVEFFKKHPNCGLLYGMADYIDAEDNYIGSYKTGPYSFQRLMQDCMVCQPAAFWRRAVVEKIGAFDEQLNFVMDYDYWIRIAKSGSEIYFLPEKLANSRLYPETKTLSQRSKIYDEIFQISMRHAEYVHHSHYQGLWHHRIFEHASASPVIRLLQYIPGAHLPVGWLHCKWDRRKAYTWQYIVAYLRRIVTNVMAKLGVKHLLSRVLGSYKSYFSNKKKIGGFYADNWMANRFTLAPKSHSNEQSLYIAGIAPKNTTVSVYVGKRLIKQYDLLAGKYSRVEFPLESVENEALRISFSNYLKETTGRRLGFLLADTNIFNEQDLW